jgi:hypothetical protein
MQGRQPNHFILISSTTQHIGGSLRNHAATWAWRLSHTSNWKGNASRLLISLDGEITKWALPLMVINAER